jgi:hypothetical protein
MAAITLYRRQPGGTYDGGTAVAHALATGGERGSTDGDPRLSTKQRTWHLWAAEAGDPPKVDDVIEDANGDRWVVDQAQVLTLGTRFRVETRLEIA